jgi:hypothetical protein
MRVKIDWSQLQSAEQKEADREAARRYLAETDWYVTRSIETGKPMPPDIAAARDAARQTASSR